MTENLSLEGRAEAFARRYHSGQYRRDGNIEYVTHCERIAARLNNAPEEERAVAWLHDTVEDTNATIQDIRREFGNLVALGVDYLTQRPEQHGPNYHEYLDQILYAPAWVQRIKILDVTDNLGSVEYLNPSGIARKISSSYTFYLPLADRIDSSLAQDLRSALLGYYTRSKAAATNPSDELRNLTTAHEPEWTTMHATDNRTLKGFIEDTR